MFLVIGEIYYDSETILGAYPKETDAETIVEIAKEKVLSDTGYPHYDRIYVKELPVNKFDIWGF